MVGSDTAPRTLEQLQSYAVGGAHITLANYEKLLKMFDGKMDVPI